MSRQANDSQLVDLFRTKVKAARIANNLSVKQLGCLTGVSAAVITTIEMGYNLPSCSCLMRLAKVLKLDLNEIAKEYDFNPAAQALSVIAVMGKKKRKEYSDLVEKAKELTV